MRWIGDIIADLESDAPIWGVSEVANKHATEFPGVDVKQQDAPHVWLELHQRERAHLMKVAKAAIDAASTSVVCSWRRNRAAQSWTCSVPH